MKIKAHLAPIYDIELYSEDEDAVEIEVSETELQNFLETSRTYHECKNKLRGRVWEKYEDLQPSDSKFWRSVKKIAARHRLIPKEIRKMSGVPNAILEGKNSSEDY